LLGYFLIKDGDEAMIKSLPKLDEAIRQVKLEELAHRIINPYIAIAIVLFVFGLIMRFIKLPKIDLKNNSAQEENLETKKKNIFQFPYLILGVIALFFYVGVEVIAGDTIIRYGQTLNIPIEKAKLFTSFTLTAMLIGYVLGIILIPKIISQQKALRFSAIMGIAFSMAAIFTDGYVSVFFIAILGLANAIVWPAIWPLAIDKLGKFTHTGSALLIMAISGGAILPLFWGQITDLAKTSEFIIPQYAYIVLIPGYLFILYYAVRGYKIGKNS
jgi:glucose/galactose transporter